MEYQPDQHFQQITRNLYISPLERCNLHCAICYTKKTNAVLSQKEILGFINRYRKTTSLETITFCGGELFLLPYMTDIINELTKRGIFIQLITNGTIDRLDSLKEPNSINLIVSLDGLERYHDKNRGKGNFKKSVQLLEKAHAKGFHTEIFSIVTKQNYADREKFEAYLTQKFQRQIPVTYHPRKPQDYLLRHPYDNRIGIMKGFDFLNSKQLVQIMQTKKTFPPKELGCYQIAVLPNGTVVGCCEGITPLGTITDPIDLLLHRLSERLTLWKQAGTIKGCLGCAEPVFVCGIKKYIQ